MGNTALLVFWLAIALLLLEGGLRVLAPHHRGLRVLLYTPSARTQFDNIDSLETLLEGTVLGFAPYTESRGFILNSRSFRTGEYTGEKRPGVYRIMALGDSFTFSSGGVPEPQMWPARLEHQLNRSGGKEVEAFALGVPGVGPRFELRLWELEHYLVRPNLVILPFFVGNDFTDEKHPGLAPWTEAEPTRLSYAFRLVRNLYRLGEKQRESARTLREASGNAASGRGGIEVELAPDAIGPRKKAAQWFLPLEMRRMRICVKENRSEFLELAADVGHVLERFGNEVRASGADLVVMIIPDEVQVNETLLDEVLDRLGLGPEDIDLDLPQRHLSELLGDAEIPYLDLLPGFREQTRHQRLYWPNNTHWNLEGHALAARLLAEYLRGSVLRDWGRRMAE